MYSLVTRFNIQITISRGKTKKTIKTHRCCRKHRFRKNNAHREIS